MINSWSDQCYALLWLTRYVHTFCDSLWSMLCPFVVLCGGGSLSWSCGAAALQVFDASCSNTPDSSTWLVIRLLQSLMTTHSFESGVSQGGGSPGPGGRNTAHRLMWSKPSRYVCCHILRVLWRLDKHVWINSVICVLPGLLFALSIWSQVPVTFPVAMATGRKSIVWMEQRRQLRFLSLL